MTAFEPRYFCVCLCFHENAVNENQKKTNKQTNKKLGNKLEKLQEKLKINTI